MAERVQFKGDPVVQDPGVPGQETLNPLGNKVAPISQELLNDPTEDEEEKDFRPQANKRPLQAHAAAIDDEDDVDEDEAGPAYARERIGARIGEPIESANSVAEVERELDADDVVPCMFQKELRLNHDGLMHTFGAGVHLVPVSIAGRTMKERHWWLKHNRVRHTGPVQANPNADNRSQQEVDA